jgi:hypothetical protein
MDDARAMKECSVCSACEQASDGSGIAQVPLHDVDAQSPQLPGVDSRLDEARDVIDRKPVVWDVGSANEVGDEGRSEPSGRARYERPQPVSS